MTRLKTGPGLATTAITIVAVAATPAAAADYYVPPGNSAATQYTEAFPAAGGSRNAERRDAGRERSPARVLGKRDARRLEARGPDGREVAELVVTTSPPTPPPGGRAGGAPTVRPPGETKPPAAQGDGPSGSSGPAEVLAQSIGAPSPGRAGALLPLTLIATIAWSAAYLLRRQRKPGT